MTSYLSIFNPLQNSPVFNEPLIFGACIQQWTCEILNESLVICRSSEVEKYIKKGVLPFFVCLLASL